LRGNKNKVISILLFSMFFFIIPSYKSVSAATIATQQSVKISASVNNKTPKQNSTIYVKVNGPAKGTVKILCNYKSTRTTYYSKIGSNGKAVLPVRIGRASKGRKVVVDVAVTYKGKVYKTKTSFTPR
jgi:competence protein ComEC